jgi:uncharacterized protein (TIRG00374 family)
LLLLWLGWRTDWRQVGHAFATLHWSLWWTSVALIILTQAVSGLRWRLLGLPLGLEQSIARYVGCYFLGMFVGLFLPSVGGDVVRAWSLAAGPGRRWAALLSVLVDRSTGLLALLVMAVVGVGVCPVKLPVWIGWSICGAAAAAGFGCSAVIWLLHRRGHGSSSLSPSADPPPNASANQRASWKNYFREAADAVAIYLGHPRLLVGTSVLAMALQAAQVGTVWLIGVGLDLTVPGLYYCLLVPVVSLLTLLPISISGMGVREASTVLLLAPLRVEGGAALTLAFLWYAAFVVASLVGIGFYLLGDYTGLKPAEVLEEAM